jgi:serine/threonine protein kinase/formylglycine-generating enzyme required for sulfatase activity
MAGTKNARDIFLEALERVPADRTAYLDEACGPDAALRQRVEALLRAHDDPGAFLSEAKPNASEAAPLPPAGAGDASRTRDRGDPAQTEDYEDPTAHVGAILAGKYKLVEEIGEGGMGSVFMAQQTEPVKRAVAVKVIKAGMDSKAVLARFEAERQALAMMDHPNIAKVLDAGTTDGGRPFFVMELVKGTPITRYCDEHRLTPRQRLELFVPVCQAIQHAHQKGIIHRDIKPSNVLVALYDDRPVPKVIDFGVAKAAGQSLTDKTLMTGFGALVGTPEYMSPEQASLNNLDIDTRSDVYSLGVLLYELLTGTTPVDRKGLGQAALLEVLRIVREVEAPRPSAKLSSIDTLPSVAANRGTEPARLSRLMKGELDWLVMKALEKDRTRRYETANGLARDIQRYLADEVVEARPPSVGYRVSKFVRRHKGQVIAASLVLVALVAGIVGTTLGLFEARRQEQIARDETAEKEKEADKAMKARNFLVRIFQKAETDVKGGNVTIRQLIAEAEGRIPVEFADQPELRAELVTAISDVKRGIARRAPQAMILEVRGSVLLQSATGKPKKAVPQALVNLDDRLTLGPDGHVQLVFLSDFHKELIESGRTVTIDSRGCEPPDAVRARDTSVLMTFVHLPKGTFYMGWGTETFYRGWGTDLQPKMKGKKTEIPEDFEIAGHDVTQGQWETVMGNCPCHFSRQGLGRQFVGDISDEELKLFPVENVSWEDAQEFIRRLNDKEHGRGWLYRLPTEAEWEYACRGGATSEDECSFNFYVDKPTNDLSSAQANFNGNFPAGKAAKGPYLERPTRVGSYQPNKLGLCDMHGNVHQWCADVYAATPLLRVFRGGSWVYNGSSSQAAFRSRYAPTYRNFNLGFRLARVPAR